MIRALRHLGWLDSRTRSSFGPIREWRRSTTNWHLGNATTITCPKRRSGTTRISLPKGFESTKRKLVPIFSFCQPDSYNLNNAKETAEFKERLVSAIWRTSHPIQFSRVEGVCKIPENVMTLRAGKSPHRIS
jgi:hypothetical protein